MNKHRLHHLWTKVRWLKPWYFLALAIISGVICIVALRANNEQMVKLRDAVYTADKNNSDVTGALRQLQAYVTTHMNTNLSNGPNAVYPPIQLVYTYDRAVQAQGDQLAASNSQFYTQAQKYCEANQPNGFYGAYRIGCIEDYLTSHHLSQSLPQIPDSLYKFDFVSPAWSPDLAGWSLVATVLLAVLFVVIFSFKLWAK